MQNILHNTKDQIVKILTISTIVFFFTIEVLAKANEVANNSQPSATTSVYISPNINTGAATSITHECATINADFNLNDSTSVDVWFAFGESSRNLDGETSKFSYSISRNSSRRLCEAEEDKTYYYQAILMDRDNLNQVEKGIIRSFTTKKQKNCSLDGVIISHGNSITFFCNDGVFGKE